MNIGDWVIVSEMPGFYGAYLLKHPESGISFVGPHNMKAPRPEQFVFLPKRPVTFAAEHKQLVCSLLPSAEFPEFGEYHSICIDDSDFAVIKLAARSFDRNDIALVKLLAR